MTARSYQLEVPCSRRWRRATSLNGRRAARLASAARPPSDYPEFAQFLVEEGIDSISLNPDTVLKTTVAILEKERKTNRAP